MAEAYVSWAKSRGYKEILGDYQSEELNKILEQFFIELRKQNGDDYEPDCLRTMLGALERHLKEKKYPISLFGREFSSCKKVLDGKVRELRAAGKGKKPSKACSLTNDEEETLWNCGQLGAHNSRSLLNTVWWSVVQSFGMRGRDSHYSLRMEEFKLQMDEAGRRYIAFVEGPSKTRQGGLNFKPRTIHPRMYAIDDIKRCPVHHFLLYQSKRPDSLEKKGPLYLSPIDDPKNGNVWYKQGRVGINMLTLFKVVK